MGDQEQDPLYVDHNTMQVFIEQFPMFTEGLNIWIMDRALDMDFNSLNHFQHLVTILLTEAIERIKQNGEDAGLKGWQVNLNNSGNA